MTTQAAITRTRIEGAMRLVDSGNQPTVRLRDVRVPGLSLVVGRRTARWSFEYKVALPGGGWSGGKRLGLGDYPAMDIDAARTAAAAAKVEVGAGLDPLVVKRARRVGNIETNASRTVSAAIARYRSERDADWTGQTCRAFGSDSAIIEVAIGAAPLALVDRGRLTAFIKEMISPDGVRLRQAIRVASLLSGLWRQAGPGGGRFAGWEWPGVDHEVAARLPVPGKHRITARSRILDEAEIHDLWPHLIAPGIWAPHRLVLALSLCTGARIGALSLLSINDLDLGDSPVIVGARDYGPTFRIRALEGRKASAKDRREGADLVLPVSTFAVGIFRQALALRAQSGSTGPNLFQGRTGPLGGPSIGGAWKMLVRQGLAPADATPHDLRRTMRSLMSEVDHPGSGSDEVAQRDH